ncbi:MAG: hypothetical protein M3Z04_17965 [Chloroflexota bacterium]|nr:hypothetical protein [Chloroflexota bacterium]
MDSGWIFVGVAFSLVWLTLAGYMAYLARRMRGSQVAEGPAPAHMADRPSQAPGA